VAYTRQSPALITSVFQETPSQTMRTPWRKCNGLSLLPCLDAAIGGGGVDDAGVGGEDVDGVIVAADGLDVPDLEGLVP
jgi:hypothetical protein